MFERHGWSPYLLRFLVWTSKCWINMRYVCVSFVSHDQWGRGIKGGWSGQKCLAMHTIMAAKFKLWKRSSTNSTLTHSILIIAMSQTTVEYIGYDGWYFSDFVFSLTALACDRTAVFRAINLPYDCSYSQPPGLYVDETMENEVLLFLAAKSCV